MKPLLKLFLAAFLFPFVSIADHMSYADYIATYASRSPIVTHSRNMQWPNSKQQVRAAIEGKATLPSTKEIRRIFRSKEARIPFLTALSYDERDKLIVAEFLKKFRKNESNLIIYARKRG